MPIVLKSGNLNVLEPSGPVHISNGIVLPEGNACWVETRCQITLVGINFLSEIILIDFYWKWIYKLELYELNVRIIVCLDVTS